MMNHLRSKLDSGTEFHGSMFQSMFDELDDPMLILNEQGMVIYANTAFCDKLGYQSTDVLLMPFFNWLHKDEVKVVKKELEAIKETEETRCFEHRLLSVEGDWEIFESFVSLITAKDVQRLVMFHLKPISKRKQAEQAIRKMQELLKETQKLARIGGWDYVLRTNSGRWTDEVFRIYGMEPIDNEVALETSLKYFHKDDQQVISGAFYKLIEKGIPYDLELRLIREGGDMIWVRTIGQAEYEEGKITRASGYMMEVTREKKTREALQRKTARLQSLREIDRAVLKGMESIEEIAELAIKHLCRLLQVDSAGIGFADYEKKSFHIISTENGCNTVKWRDQSCSEEEFEKLILYKSKNLIVDDMSVEVGVAKQLFGFIGIHSAANMPFESTDGFIGMINISYKESHEFMEEEMETIREICTQVVLAIEKYQLYLMREQYANQLEEKVKERTAQLEAANKELEAFSYSVSHDLRAPLRAVDGYVRILMEDYGTSLDEEGKRICHVISNSAKQMGVLIDDLLALSRLGRAELQPILLDMESMVRSIYLEITTKEEQERMQFHIGTLPKAYGDPTLLRQVWINLISNAIKFSSKKQQGIIEISATEGESDVIYTIRDYGEGFDMQYVDKLFGVFQRLHSSKEFEGTGVGLAIVHRIITRHGGKVWAEGVPNEGATFHISLKKGEKDWIKTR